MRPSPQRLLLGPLLLIAAGAGPAGGNDSAVGVAEARELLFGPLPDAAAEAAASSACGPMSAAGSRSAAAPTTPSCPAMAPRSMPPSWR